MYGGKEVLSMLKMYFSSKIGVTCAAVKTRRNGNK